ncbi:membrane protein containing HD superfamilyhydrolase domain [Nonlabens ulvanivorans]|uniref:Membrane protein containing HD superfamilyhydrolase domain n=1 Tax=Nonlabens ulvanivorans TaxID=906888 RepID=A0A081DE05_NONUL|nr:HDIG domain-containing metalloprotein [Nonlabens ulvanivorans]GAK77151.1 membrane protein containing HD superfamilyhydrolase domain [Nonlabens ulvanivorans]
MKKNNSSFYKYQDILIRIAIIIASTIITIYFFPKSDRFKYDYKKGEPWQYETLYAPFSFPIKKSPDAIKQEIDFIKQNTPKYFDIEPNISYVVKEIVQNEYRIIIPDTILTSNLDREFNEVDFVLDQFYTNYYLEKPLEIDENQPVIIQTKEGFEEVAYHKILKPKDLKNKITSLVKETEFKDKKWLAEVLLKNIKSNVNLNLNLTNQIIEDEVSKVLPTRGVVPLNSRIIAQGEIVEGEKYQILNTLNETYQAQTWSESQYVWRLIGYIILVALTFTILLLFLFNYRPDIYNNSRKLLFIFFNLLTIILLTTLVVNINSLYVYVVPVCILPLILKSFFDARVGLFTHVLTILILSFIVPNGEEFLFLQIIAGIVTILSSSEIYKRANLFITIGQIVLIYVSSYFAFYAINQGGVIGWEWNKVSYFILCGLAMLFVWPLIYIYEKLFGLVSDVSLLELSDTNSKLLKELSNKAPGTFHHSLNVANIAESAADAINANAMLARVGALYHDIGKMGGNPTYFSENQGSGINPHDDLDPEESASIIINHTITGIEIAKKYKMPDRIIDFIRTHHGDSTVYYFYKKALASNPNLDIKDYQYPGPKPFSPETAILMIADSVEAASKSLKNPTSTSINMLVENIINKQVEEKQFINADITFKQIEIIKSVIKKKLANIYHLRIEYPE